MDRRYIALRVPEFPGGPAQPIWSGPSQDAVRGAIERDRAIWQALMALALVAPDGSVQGTLGEFLSSVMSCKSVRYAIADVPDSESSVVQPIGTGSLVDARGNRLG